MCAEHPRAWRVRMAWHHPRMSTPAPLLADDALPDARICVGLSGGLDSTVLLHALARHPRMRRGALRALHVHHGLHAAADGWAEHCRQLCGQLGVPLAVAYVHVEPQGEGPEAAARRARHAAFASQVQPDEVLALAHHQDDQAETFLLHALRGSGVEGLAAMREDRTLGGHPVWRPLLRVPRARLLAYATHHGLTWVQDPSNDDDTLDRNFLRCHVLPLLRQRWPHASAALGRAADLCAQASHLLGDEDRHALLQVYGGDGRDLSRRALLSLPAERRARVLRLWVAECGLPALPAHGVEQIEAVLLRARPDAQARFDWQHASIRAWRDRLHAGVRRAPLPSDWWVPWSGDAPLALPGGGTLQLDGIARFASPVRVCARRGGERIALAGRTHSHALKHVLQEHGIAPWVRERMPLLCDTQGEVVAAGDRILAGGFAQWLASHDARLVWRDD